MYVSSSPIVPSSSAACACGNCFCCRCFECCCCCWCSCACSDNCCNVGLLLLFMFKMFRELRFVSSGMFARLPPPPMLFLLAPSFNIGPMTEDMAVLSSPPPLSATDPSAEASSPRSSSNSRLTLEDVVPRLVVAWVSSRPVVPAVYMSLCVPSSSSALETSSRWPWEGPTRPAKELSPPPPPPFLLTLPLEDSLRRLLLLPPPPFGRRLMLEEPGLRRIIFFSHARCAISPPLIYR
mmetsp:Transcript_34681/g.83831  ORF Transcript_34681/g.83831 Transcript_34681/m.83831 type:complete len:237 (-) Transcript_34681:158-868(-)